MAQTGEVKKDLGSVFGVGGKDRLQIAVQCHDHTMRLAGISGKKFYTEIESNIEAGTLVAGYYGFDSIALGLDAYNIEIEALGGKMIYGENSMPTIDFREPLIKNPEDLKRLKKKRINFHKDGRFPFVFELMDRGCEYGFSTGFFCAPFSMAVGMMGYPALIKAMRKNPQFAHELFQFIVDDVLVPYIKVQNEYSGALMAVGADAWACIPNLSVKEMMEWVVPYNLRLSKKIKKFGVVAMNVSGDYCEERLEKFDPEILHGSFDVQIASTGAPALFLAMGRWHEYPMEAVRDYTAKYRKKGQKVTITAGVNARLLRDGPAEKIVDNIKRFIDAFARDHNLSIFLANIPADAPSDHIHAAVAAVKTYGKLPIADNLDIIEFELPHRESFNEWKQKPTPFPKTEVRRGLAGLLWQQMEPINNIEEFKEKYKDKTLKILYNLTDQKYGALITVENGKLDVKHIRNDKETLENLEVDASMVCTAELFFDFSSGNISKISALFKMLTRKLKISGMKKMKELGEIIALLS